MFTGRLYVYVAFGFLFSVSGAFAQIRSGTITGGVTDPSHAAIQDAVITVINTATTISNTTRTTQAGAYTVPYLETGTYSITIVKQGFETFQTTGVRLDSSQTARVDATLMIGSTGAKVEVVGSVELLQTDTSSVSGAIGSQVIDSIPNITQNPLYYAGLQNGVQPRNETSTSTSVGSFGIGVAGRAQFSAYGVNGGRAFENDIQLDGLPIMGGGFNEAAILPNTEGFRRFGSSTITSRRNTATDRA